jgi:single-stranded DNA-binding protein
MNKIILMGRLTKNPEIKYAGKDNNMAVARYTLAVNLRFKKDFKTVYTIDVIVEEHCLFVQSLFFSER